MAKTRQGCALLSPLELLAVKAVGRVTSASLVGRVASAVGGVASVVVGGVVSASAVGGVVSVSAVGGVASASVMGRVVSASVVGGAASAGRQWQHGRCVFSVCGVGLRNGGGDISSGVDGIRCPRSGVPGGDGCDVICGCSDSGHMASGGGHIVGKVL
eukprot:g16869.t1